MRVALQQTTVQNDPLELVANVRLLDDERKAARLVVLKTIVAFCIQMKGIIFVAISGS